MATGTSNKKAAKAATKKAPVTKKKATAKSKAKPKAKAKAVVKYEAKDVVLTATQQKSLDIIHKNQDRIEGSAETMLKLAADSGKRMLKLKDEITAKYGRVWKAWAQEAGNIKAATGVNYEQATRYMKLAANPAQLALVDATSIEGAVKQIEHMKKPEKKAAAEAKAKATKTGKSQKTATDGIITQATLDEIERCMDIEELQAVIELARQRISELQQMATEDDGDDDAIDGTATQIEDDEDAAAAVADAIS